MGEWLQKYINQLKELWGKLNKRAKIIIGVSALAIMLALIFLIVFSGEGKYTSLYQDLSAEDADAIVERLNENNIDYKLANNGSTILVPENRVHEVRLDMAGEGLPDQGMVGFEIFDQSNFGTTDFERQVNFYRALGGEMSRTIQDMEIIDYARVQITAPEESLYTDEEKPSEASVLIKVKSGYNIGENEIQAISNLVAGGVQGLDKGNVTIVDSNGNLLSNNSGDGSISSNEMTLNQIELEREFENNLKSDLNSMLTKVLGPGNFSVQVNAKLNFDQRETESKTYSPVVDDEGIVRSEEKSEVQQQSTSGTADGAPGTETNLPQEDIPEYQGEDGEGENSNYESEDTVTNYEINEKIDKQVYAPGDVEQLSVSVMLNGEQDDETVESIEDAVRAAIGYQEERNDTVNVSNVQFDDSLEEEVAQAEEAAAAENRRQMYIYAGLIIFILLTLVILFFVLRRNEEEYEPGETVDMMVEDEMQKAKSESSATELSEEEKERIAMKEDIEEIVNNRPEEVAQLLKSWLEED
ncbi:MAG: flagellar basal-body MS-ring/collar protein FliF [Bacillota bacterium]